MSIYDWSTNPANNTVKPGGIDWSEGMLPSAVNNSARVMMSDVATWLATPTFPTGLSVTGAVTATGTITAPILAIDANVHISKPTGSLVDVTFDANDVLRYAQSGNQWDFIIGGGSVFSLNALGGSLPGTFNATTLQNSGNQVWHAGNFDPATKQNTLGFTPYNATNPAGYISAINSGMVTTALGYTPYNSSNPAAYISGINSGMVTTALGYTPANKAGDTFSGAIKRDANLYMDLISGTLADISFDSGDVLRYDRAANKFFFFIGGTAVASLDASGNLKVLGNVTASTAP